MTGNKLHGSLPTTFGQLSNLKMLCLAGNDFKGRLPSEIAHLTKLEQVWLSNNQFSGSLPEGLLEKWKSLRLLDFSKNQFRGKIPSIGISNRNPQLVNLFLEGNSFTGSLTEDPKGLNLLQVLDIGDNLISSSIPSGWMSLTKLRNVNLARNRMTGTIPTEILSLTNLEILVLVRCLTTNWGEGGLRIQLPWCLW